jgi:hypothetical protein
MPRAEGMQKPMNYSTILTQDYSRNAEVLGKQDEVQGPAAPAVVLSSLREAMSG